MRTFCTLGLLLAVVAGSMAADEPAPIAPDTTTSQLILLRQKSVQMELKLTEADVKKIMEFTNKESGEFGKALKLSEAEREAKFKELEKANRKFLQDTLTAAQHKRLEQITLQVTGVRQLTRPEVAKTLGLTAEQQGKFKELAQEARKELGAIYELKDRATKNERLAKLRETTNKKIEAVLTAEQKTKALELVGEWFKGEIVFEEPE
jgi:hypothetical protein